jgi:hypothetical protein
MTRSAAIAPKVVHQERGRSANAQERNAEERVEDCVHRLRSARSARAMSRGRRQWYVQRTANRLIRLEGFTRKESGLFPGVASKLPWE